MRPRLPRVQAAWGCLWARQQGTLDHPARCCRAEWHRLLALWLIQGLQHVLAAQLGEGDKVPKGSRGGETYFKWQESPTKRTWLEGTESICCY